MKLKPSLCTLALGLSLALGCDSSAPRGEIPLSAESPPPAQPQIPLPKPKGALPKTHSFSGIVTAVDQNGFELAVGWKMANKTWRWNRDGSQTLIQEEPYDNSRPKRLSTAGTPLGGEREQIAARDSTGEETYHVLDLQIGDRVWAHTRVDKGEERVTQIMICRRPGGKIPPLPQDQWGNPSYLSTLYQAEQDWEEKRIPIPQKYLNKDGQYPWTNPPYLPLPLAPMPRPVAAKP